jgi:hypothetical protein
MRHLALPLAALLLVGCANADIPTANEPSVAAHRLAPQTAPADPATEPDGDATGGPRAAVALWPAVIPVPAVGSLVDMPSDDGHLLAWGLEGDGSDALGTYLDQLSSAGFTLIEDRADAHRLTSGTWEVTVTVIEQPGGLDIEVSATPTYTASD